MERTLMDNAKLDSLGKVKAKLEVVLGRRELDLESLMAMGPGSIIELDSLAGEAVDVVVSGVSVARAEVVVIDENFGIRVTEMLDKGRG